MARIQRAGADKERRGEERRGEERIGVRFGSNEKRLESGSRYFVNIERYVLGTGNVCFERF